MVLSSAKCADHRPACRPFRPVAEGDTQALLAAAFVAGAWRLPLAQRLEAASAPLEAVDLSFVGGEATIQRAIRELRSEAATTAHVLGGVEVRH